jgi:hypothetical protein
MILWYQGPVQDCIPSSLFGIGDGDPLSRVVSGKQRMQRAVRGIVREYSFHMREPVHPLADMFEGYILDYSSGRDRNNITAQFPESITDEMTLGIAACPQREEKQESNIVPLIVTGDGRKKISLEGRITNVADIKLGDLIGVPKNSRIRLDLIWLGTKGEYQNDPRDGVEDANKNNQLIRQHADRASFYELGNMLAKMYKCESRMYEEIGRRVASAFGLEPVEAWALKQLLDFEWPLAESDEECVGQLSRAIDDAWGLRAVEETVKKFKNISEDKIRDILRAH